MNDREKGRWDETDGCEGRSRMEEVDGRQKSRTEEARLGATGKSVTRRGRESVLKRRGRRNSAGTAVF